MGVILNFRMHSSALGWNSGFSDRKKNAIFYNKTNLSVEGRAKGKNRDRVKKKLENEYTILKATISLSNAKNFRLTSSQRESLYKMSKRKNEQFCTDTEGKSYLLVQWSFHCTPVPSFQEWIAKVNHVPTGDVQHCRSKWEEATNLWYFF